MDMYASAAPISSSASRDARGSVQYHPSIWGDHFLSYTPQLTEISGAEREEHETQKEKVKILLQEIPDDSRNKIEVIDAIQRLGVGYHFEKEIEKSLKSIHEACLIHRQNDLRDVSLYFRLLRQQGYHVPCEVFEKFTDMEGNFNGSLIHDIEAMTNLYEASHMGICGEEILDKALEFSSFHLESLVCGMTNSHATHVKETLKNPISKCLPRLGARKFISTYQGEEMHNDIILRFAKLDFNMVQKLHQSELRDLTRWWKDLDLTNKLSFARDRIVECYLWIVGVYFEPRYSKARKILTKVIYMAAILDDIYDVYGTLDELQLFTNVLQSWDVKTMEELPPYMRIFYKALLEIYEEMENGMEDATNLYRVQYAKEEMKKLANAYFEEAKWSFSKHMPTVAEYMKVALASCGYMMMTITSLVSMEDQVTKEEFDWILSEPLIVRASLTICRLMDDLVGYGIENKISAMNCHMHEKGISEKEASRELGEQVKKAWKDINKEVMEPRLASLPILMSIVNLTRVIHFLYADEDGFSNSKRKTKDSITCVLVKPVTM